MKKHQKKLPVLNNDHGATAVLVAICLTMLIGFAALAVDVGYLYATRNELQNVADAAALAGAGYLGTVYAALTYTEQQDYTFSRTEVVDAIQQVAQKNSAAGVNITIADSGINALGEDIVIGIWNGTSVSASLTSPDAVRVVARRQEGVNGPVSTFFANIFGVADMEVGAVATAALTGPATAAEGTLRTPFAISELIFEQPCTEEIIFSPTTDSCAGWHNFVDDANTNDLSDKLFGLIQGHETKDYLCDTCGDDTLTLGDAWLDTNFDLNKEATPEITAAFTTGNPMNFIGGDLGALFNGVTLDSTYDGNTGNAINKNGDIVVNKFPVAPFPALFDYFRYRDGDGNDDWWTATVPVYEDGDTCGNPSGPINIVGFARIIVKMPNPPPDKTVSVYIDCNQSIIRGRGGGGLSGNLKGSIPNLVE
jgi:Flp pilus assembly protein TadG